MLIACEIRIILSGLMMFNGDYEVIMGNRFQPKRAILSGLSSPHWHPLSPSVFGVSGSSLPRSGTFTSTSRAEAEITDLDG